MEQINEQELIQEILDGKTARFGYFLDAYSPLIHSLILQIVLNSEDAEELTADTFIKAFDMLSRFEGKGKFSTWLYRIAYNKAISFTRKKKKIIFDEKLLDKVSIFDADCLLSEEEDVEKVEQLQRCIQLLLEEDKALIHLFYYQQCNINEVAEILSISVSNVKVRLHRVRKKLYLMMSKS